MLSVYIYPVCLIMFALCVGVVAYLHGRQASHNRIVLTGGALGVLTFALQYVPPPHWLMADFEKAYWPAGKAVINGDPQALTELLAKGAYGFVNLPIVAYLFAPFAVMHIYVADVIFLALGGLSCLLLWRELVRFADLKAPESAILLFLAIGSGPAAYSVVNGNTSQMVLILVIWGLVAYMRQRDMTAGILFALAALIKPALIVLGIFTLLRGRWRVTAAGAGVCVTATLLSILIFGWDMHVVWLAQTIMPALDGTIMAHNVQSISGFVSRAIAGTAYLNDWDPHPVPALAATLTKILQLLTAATIITCLVVLARRKNREHTTPLEISFVLMALILLPNLSWNHYYVWAFIPLALCLRHAFPLRTARADQIIALISAGLMATPVFMWESSSPLIQEIFGRFIVSLPFIGAVMLLGIMVRQVFAPQPDSWAVPDIHEARPTAFDPPLKWPLLNNRSDR